MSRAQIARRIHSEMQRDGLLGPWFIHTLLKGRRALRLSQRKHCN